jgi:DNA polymerase-3 subunit gamma/tau
MSEQYIVSARKYRPQTFDTVVGQEHITTTLKNAVRQQHLAHAYLFCGPRGVGKTTCARILAKTINCEQPTADTEACGVCATCQSFGNNTSFNVFELDAASNNSVEDIRNLIDQVRFAPQQGKYKIYIIDEVHMLSASAFNAFLKTLEEPPSYAIFILATTEKHRILPTILSRCQIFDFRRITTHDISAHLRGITEKEGLQAEDAALHVIAQKSEGCMRDALSMLDRISGFTGGVLSYAQTMAHLNLLDADYYFRLTDHMLAQDVGSTLLLLDQALEKGFEGDVILDGLAEHMRNLLLCKDQRMAKLLDVPNDHKPVYFEKANQAPPAFVLSSLNVINDAALGYKNASNKRLHVELCLIRLCYVLQAVKPGASGAGLEKKNTDELIRPSAKVAAQPSSQPATPHSDPVSFSPASGSSVATAATGSGGSAVAAPPPSAGRASGEAASLGAGTESSPNTSASGSATSGGAHVTEPSTPARAATVAAQSSPSVSPSAADSRPSSENRAIPTSQSSSPSGPGIPASASAAPGRVPASGSPSSSPVSPTVPASAPPAPGQPPAPATRRISRNLMDIDDAMNDLGQERKQEVREMTDALVEELFEQYRNKAREQNRGVLYAQLSMMRVEAQPPDEVRIVSPTEMINEYALDNRNDLIDFFTRHMGTTIRVTTEVRKDPTVEQEQKRVLSKNEIFDVMVKKNPLLGALKDGMNLQIDY